jgi:hypothetical protein
MDFPDMKSLISAAEVHDFRQPLEKETTLEYRNALADHVRPRDLIESEEIRNGCGWDKWDDDQKRGMLKRSGLKL